MAEKVKIDIDAVINTGDSLQKLRELKRAQKEVVAGSAEYKKLAAAIRDTGDALDSAALGADDLKGSLEAAPGPVGNLFKGLKQVELATKSWGLALKATGIGLLVSTIGLLVAAFSKVEGSTKALEPLFIQLEKTMGGLVQAFTPLLEMFAELAGEILPYVTKGIQLYYGAFVSLFTLIKEQGVGVGKIIAGIFTQDASLLKEGIDQLGNSFSKAGETFNKFQEDFDAGYAKQSETEKKLAEEAAERARKAEEARQKAEEARRKAFEERLKNIEAQDKLEEALLKKQKEEALTLAQTEQEKLDVERKFAELSQKQRLQDLQDKMALYKKDSLEYKALQTEKVNVESDYISQLRGFAEQQKKINEEAAKKKEEDEKKAAEIARGIRLTELQAQLEDLDRQNQQLEFDFQADLERLAQQKEILKQQEEVELSNTELNEFQKSEIRKKFADARKKISDDEIANEKAANAARVELNNAYADLAGQFGQTLQQLAGKNKAVAITGIIIEQAANIAKIVSNTAVANAKSVAAFPITGGMPWVAINTASAALSIATSIASARKAIQQINSTPGEGGGGAAGGGASLGAAPTFSSRQGMSAPQIQTTPGATPESQIASTISRAQNRPIQAYVVSQQVSSQQALDRRTNGAATFGGG